MMIKPTRTRSHGRSALALALILGPLALSSVRGDQTGPEATKLNAEYSTAAAVRTVMEKFVKTGLLVETPMTRIADPLKFEILAAVLQ